jgi:preprotein translocase subunit SecA
MFRLSNASITPLLTGRRFLSESTDWHPETVAARDRLAESRGTLDAVARLEPRVAALADDELSSEARALRHRLNRARDSDESRVRAFALTREAARRTLGLRPSDEQLACGLALHRGKVAELATGEGKTLAAVAPVFLHALSGEGAHVLTFNDYLARRDAQWMGPVYRLLGLTVSYIQEGMTPDERRSAYAADVTYLTAKEAGFDLLRDGMCSAAAEQVHRPLHFALVDEADSVLIDEARIPLVIAGALDSAQLPLPQLAALARTLEPSTHFDTDEHDRNVFLTDKGARRLEAEIGCGNLFDETNVALLASARNALHAEHLLERDVHYIARGGRIELVDELTGRVAENRHLPDGLQAAVEAKEGLRLGREGRLLGSITLQHFLGLYPHLCGMTATAAASAGEIEEIYRLDVAVIPPHRPCVRIDEPDRIFASDEARDRAVLDEIRAWHERGRPLLVGTASITESERLAAELARHAIDCQVLNAKNDAEEATIVAGAGAPGAVTISTNMAGRGTDIRLGGRDESRREEVLAVGGLYVIGTHRHESRRIDQQLRGRAGRQGDPGSSCFFVSLQDDLLQRYGISGLVPERFRPHEIEASLTSPLVRREVDRAYRIVEGECQDVRRRLYEYSGMLERQRHYVADWRQKLLDGDGSTDLLAEHRAGRVAELRERLGAGAVSDIENRLTIGVLDRCWSEYLTEMQAVRDEAHLVTLDGREPLAEFTRTAMRAFETLVEHIDDQVLEAFDRLEIGEKGVDWDQAGLGGPSATWTYLVHDQVFGGNVLLAMSNRAGVALWGAILLGPVLFVWGLYQHWLGRKRRASLEP